MGTKTGSPLRAYVARGVQKHMKTLLRICSPLAKSIRKAILLGSAHLLLALVWLFEFAEIILQRARVTQAWKQLRKHLLYGVAFLFFTLRAFLSLGKATATSLHRLVVIRPHQALLSRNGWYHSYHKFTPTRFVHGGILGLYVIAISGVLIVNIAKTFAGDTNTSWDFSNTNQYVLSDGLEFGNNEVRMKAQNYVTDEHTAALYHMDEIGGAVAVDSSDNANDATVSDTTFETGNLNNALGLNGTNAFATATDSASLSLGSQQTVEAWTKLDENLSPGSIEQRQTIVDKGEYKLYYDNESGKLAYEVENNNYGVWTEAGGNDINGSWDQNGKRAVTSSVMMDDDLYAGLGIDTADAEVWMWDGATWAMIGGDGINASWADQTFEYVYSIETDGTNIYAGLGSTAGDAEVWRWDGTTWEKIGGDAVNSSWQINMFELVSALDYFGGSLYAGLGSSANDAEVWRWNGTDWTKVGGDSLNSGWTTNFELVAAFANDGTNLYAGIGSSANDAEVWRWNGTSWSKIGGDSLNSGWTTNYETVRALYWHGSTLYAGLGDSTGDGEVWSWNGSAWTKIGGDSINSGWNSDYEYVIAFSHDGSNLYAGLGSGNGDGEVWSWNGSSWTKVAGDGVNGGWTAAQGDVIYTLTSSGTTIFAGTYDSAGSGYVYEWNGASWTRLGGQYENNSWGYYGQGSVEVLFSARGNMYAGLGSVAGAAQVWRWNGSQWTIIGGQGINGSWESDTFELVTSMTTYGGNLVVGLGSSANDGEVWSWDGTTWTKLGGDSLNGGWTTNFEEVNSLASYENYLYAGLGNSANDGEVWRWDGVSWTKIGGDSINGGWTTGIERVASMTIHDGMLHVGLGASAGDGEVWRWNGATWSKIGGDSLNSGWDNTIEQVEALITYDGKLIAALGNSADDGEVWEWNGSAWAKLGGDDVNGSWTAATYERVRGLTVYNGDLYAGLGSSTGDGEVWRWDGSTWEKVAGNSVNGSWGNTMEEVESFTVYNGRLYAGTGNTANTDSIVWRWGDNAYLESTVDTFDTDWRHVAGSYDGTTLNLYIDGTLNASLNKTVSVQDGNKALLIGTGYGGREQGKPQSYFSGLIDEVRLSSIARSSFTTQAYSSTPQTAELATAGLVAGVSDFDAFQTVENADGATLAYRISNDDGATWQYWDGGAWAASDELTEANTATVINDEINSFPRTFYGIKWQAVITSDGTQQPSLQEVSIGSNSDVNAPDTNATSIQGYKSFGGDSLASNAWTNGLSPYFTWTPGTDSGAGIKGYCLYLGTDNSADPVTTKGLLGISPEYAGNFCQYLVTDPEVDLSSPGSIGTPMTTSNDPYYLLVKAIDNAGNITNDTASFHFRFDNTPPTNPGYITAPSGFINTKETTLSWPTVGAQAPSDAASGLAGLQYRINNTAWYGDSHSGTGDMSDLLTNDGIYTTTETPDFSNIDEGINTVYFRSWDQAGNVTSSYASATLKVNTAGSPSEPQNLDASPDFNTSNAFSFSWTPPVTFVGDVNNITYCYTINTLPSSGNCTFTSAGATSLATGAYATQPGLNTLYLVARDESSNINYASYTSTTFTADTPAPGIPSNMDIVDVSIKATSKWRLAITWEEPDDTGSGITNYRVYRSTNNSTFTFVGSSSSTTYIDANLSQQTYYYYVQACDNTNNCGAVSTTVSLLPTGKYTEPATLTSNPQASNVTTKKATITWTTDRTSDSKIALGTTSGQYGSSEVGNSDQVTLHTLELDNLAAGTTYYYVAKWTDEDGNTGTSQEFTFTTAPAPVVKEIETLGVGLSSATIQFSSKGATKVNLYFGQSDAFGGLKSINTSLAESEYTFGLEGLEDGTKYFYRLSAFDAEGGEYPGNIFSFTTPPRPRINNLRFQPVPGEPTSTQMVTWETNVPSTSIVTYGKVGSVGTDLQNSELKTSHEMRINNLEDDSQYFIQAQGRDRDGNLATSDRQQFRTALDTRPPRVFDITVESSIRGTGAEARGQVVVSWKTDEPSMSQVAFAEGSNATTFNSRTAEDTALTTDHLVIVSDLPTSKVYSLQPLSKDKANNVGEGEVQSAIIGRASESVLTVILNTLQRVFGL